MRLGNITESLKSFLDPTQVGYLIFYATNRCNFRCDFCFYYAEIEKGRKPKELTIEEITRFTEQLGPLLQLSITGGEPFLRKGLIQITRLFIENCSARYITIPTNGSLTAKMVEYLEEILPVYPDTFVRLTFSIDGIGDDHDKARSMEGSFKKIQQSLEAINPLRDRFPNLVLDANSVFTARNENTLLETLRHLDRAFSFDNLSITFARGNIKDPSLKTQAKEAYVRINEFLETVRRTKENRFLYPIWRGVRDVSRRNLIDTEFNDKFVTPCVAGKKLVVVSETGDVYPCEILEKKMGNLRDVDFNINTILKNNKSTELRNWIKDTECKCSFECALAANVVWNSSMYPKLVLSSLRNIGK